MAREEVGQGGMEMTTNERGLKYSATERPETPMKLIDAAIARAKAREAEMKDAPRSLPSRNGRVGRFPHLNEREMEAEARLADQVEFMDARERTIFDLRIRRSPPVSLQDIADQLKTSRQSVHAALADLIDFGPKSKWPIVRSKTSGRKRRVRALCREASTAA
jgi:hypothetical protein